MNIGVARNIIMWATSNDMLTLSRSAHGPLGYLRKSGSGPGMKYESSSLRAPATWVWRSRSATSTGSNVFGSEPG